MQSLINICPSLPSHYTEILLLTARGRETIIALCVFLLKSCDAQENVVQYLMTVAKKIRGCRWQFNLNVDNNAIWHEISWFSCRIANVLSFIASKNSAYSLPIKDLQISLVKEMLEEVTSFMEMTESKQSKRFHCLLQGF